MSNNKLKYWEVSTTQIIKANTKAEAVAAVVPRKVAGVKVLSSDVFAERISAGAAHALASQPV
jgi:hypothetical protein